MSDLGDSGRLNREPRVRVTVRLLQSDLEKYQEIAELLGGDLSKLIRTALEEYVRNHTTEIEARREP